jgi:Xaa-Pro aminopeptidase
MEWGAKIQDVQKHLIQAGIDGWLLYDFDGINSLARHFLNIDLGALITRRFFYWIPTKGNPVKILHVIEPHILSDLPGNVLLYLKWQELEAQVSHVLKGTKTVAMEFSPRNAIPYLSKVDAGIVDLVRSFQVEVVSSASFLQNYTCVLDEEQFELHLEATNLLDQVVGEAWEKISHALRKSIEINEYEVQQFIANQIASRGFMTDALPIVAVNAHSADPHYEPAKEGSSAIKKGDFILIDLWCKKQHPKGIYGDICRVAVADVTATEKQNEIFSIVRAAQKAATEFVINRYAKGESLQGYEVDQVSRKIIEEKGYGKYFTHRTGHNIYTKDHGPGAHIDSLETQDLRELIPRTCFSIEPGIYLPEDFGIRLEYDIFLGDQGKVYVTGGFQDTILPLLSRSS